MLQLENSTPFAAAIAPLADEDGVDAVYVCTKATFCWHPKLDVAAVQRPISLTDRYRGEPTTSSLVEAGEHHIGKGGTDVVLDGCAHAPGGRPVTSCPVSVSVAERRKVVAVYGDRQWQSLEGTTAPAPFVEMPLVYERAFGGTVEGGDAATRDVSARNPVGVGLDRRAGAAVPNLEDPEAPVTGGGGRPLPTGFGPLAPGWQPRARFAGTYDAGWVRQRAPLLPGDFNVRFFNAAPPELAFDRFLRGGEPVEILGASRRGPIKFSVPRCRLRVTVCVGGVWEAIAAYLETVALWPEDDAVTLTWRAKLRCDRRMLAVERVRIEVSQMEVQ